MENHFVAQLRLLETDVASNIFLARNGQFDSGLNYLPKKYCQSIHLHLKINNLLTDSQGRLVNFLFRGGA